ncbi:MAG: glycine--tRNA ligase [Chlamydiia bacterium]
MSKPSILEDLKPIVALCKRRGFIYPGSEIYGGFANTYSYGPYGCELKRNIKNLWWKMFIEQREDMVGQDGPILLHPKVWEASGHVAGFNDAMVDCKSCKGRFRADHLIEKALQKDVEGLSVDALSELLLQEPIPCPKCGKQTWTAARHFNLMFQTQISKTSDQDIAYLRPETAQAIFADFRNILDTMRVQIPFGVGQIGKAFRNEITPGNFIFRTIEFEQMEIEYFIAPEGWESHFERWLEQMQLWCRRIGLKESSTSLFEHPAEKLSHYSKRTVDVMFQFPFGRAELYGLAYRTNFDLSQHAEHSHTNLTYVDPKTHERFIPHVIEPSFGVDRTLLALLCDAYEEQDLGEGDMRTVLHFAPIVAPVKMAIFPLMRKEELINVAKSIFGDLHKRFAIQYDESAAIGKRYRRQDEIGTPFCVTVDYQTLEDQTVTWRDRDTMEQVRCPIDQLASRLEASLTF